MLFGFCLGLLSLLPSGSMTAPADSVDFYLEDHRWTHRLVVVFAPTDTTPALEAQRRRLQDVGDGFRDRDLLLLTLLGETGEGTRRSAPEQSGRPLTRSATQRLYERFDVPRDSFRLVLVGKDGTEKRREADPVSARSLFDTIDAMPMRQREMRDGNAPD